MESNSSFAGKRVHQLGSADCSNTIRPSTKRMQPAGSTSWMSRSTWNISLLLALCHVTVVTGTIGERFPCYNQSQPTFTRSILLTRGRRAIRFPRSFHFRPPPFECYPPFRSFSLVYLEVGTRASFLPFDNPTTFTLRTPQLL